MQPHRKGHKAKNKIIQRRIERKQRQWQKVNLAGQGKHSRKKKPKNKVKSPKPSKLYPCGPKQMTLGEAFQ
jgi:hypothetical protein